MRMMLLPSRLKALRAAIAMRRKPSGVTLKQVLGGFGLCCCRRGFRGKGLQMATNHTAIIHNMRSCSPHKTYRSYLVEAL